jgi:putative methyltransferase
MNKRKLTNYDAIDCCAAPGNKTTQLAALLQGPHTKLHAFDKSVTRCELLRSRVAQAGADTRVITYNDDFLQQDPKSKKFQRVKTVLLDPSCSGSGSYSIERLNEERLVETDARVLRLAQFQREALCHALKFEQAELVSYSTCSILYPENEDVVKNALDIFHGEWELVEALPSWPRRGMSRKDGLTEDQAKLVVRADYNLGDKTGGFFLALFARKKSQHHNKSEPSVPLHEMLLPGKQRKRPSSVIMTSDKAMRYKKLIRMIYYG